jgi:hypothetical protein
LLNAALYQWLLRGFGKPRRDETVELAVSDVAALPWPELSDASWGRLARHVSRVRKALENADPYARLDRYWAERQALDDRVFELLDVGPRLRAVVQAELVRAE